MVYNIGKLGSFHFNKTENLNQTELQHRER